MLSVENVIFICLKHYWFKMVVGRLKRITEEVGSTLLVGTIT